MQDQKSLQCYNCKSVILKLPDSQVRKLDGLSFVCEGCGHQNLLKGTHFKRSDITDPTLHTISFENVFV